MLDPLYTAPAFSAHHHHLWWLVLAIVVLALVMPLAWVLGHGGGKPAR